MKEAKKLFEAMSGVDDDLLLRSEEATRKKKKKIIPFVKYASTAAAAACAIFVIGVVMSQTPSMKSSDSARNVEPNAMSDNAASLHTVREAEAMEGVDYAPDYAAEESEDGSAYEMTTEEAAETADCNNEAPSSTDSMKAEAQESKGGLVMEPTLGTRLKKVFGNTYKSESMNGFANVPADDQDLIDVQDLGIPERFRYLGTQVSEEDCAITLDVEGIATQKHFTKVTVLGWDEETSDGLAIMCMNLDDEIPTDAECDSLEGQVVKKENVTEARIGGFTKNDGMVNIQVLYPDDRLIIVEGYIDPVECMTILDAFENVK